jgi:hypothetical protein
MTWRYPSSPGSMMVARSAPAAPQFTFTLFAPVLRR